MNEQRRVFIASSAEGLHVAEAVNIKLEHEARVKLWDNAFDLSSVTITSLCARARDADFSVFVFHKDDEAIIRGKTYSIVRDNVLFELGLFIGALGIDRCFILVPKTLEDDFRLPSDLAGVTFSSYDDTLDDMVDAVAASSAKIKMAIRKLGARQAEQTEADQKTDIKPKDDHLRSMESELWRLKIDLERLQEQAARLSAAVESHFYSIAKPATETEIQAWEDGAKASYPIEEKISRHQVYYIDRDVVLPTLFGAHSQRRMYRNSPPPPPSRAGRRRREATA